MLDLNLSQYQDTETEDTFSLEAFNAISFNGDGVKEVRVEKDKEYEMLQILKEYKPESLTFIKQVELNQRLYHAGMDSNKRIDRTNYNDFNLELTMGLIDKFKDWRKRRSESNKNKKVLAEKGQEFLSKLIERIKSMETDYVAESNTVEIEMGRIDSIVNQKNPERLDIKTNIANLERLIKNLSIKDTDVFSNIEKKVKDGNSKFDMVEYCAKLHGMVLVDKPKYNKGYLMVYGPYEDSLLRIVTEPPNYVVRGSVIEEDVDTREMVSLNIPSLKEIQAIAETVLRLSKKYYTVQKKQAEDQSSESADVKWDLDEMAKKDTDRAQYLLECMGCHRQFLIFADDVVGEGAIGAIINYLRACFAQYKPK